LSSLRWSGCRDARKTRTSVIRSWRSRARRATVRRTHLQAERVTAVQGSGSLSAPCAALARAKAYALTAASLRVRDSGVLWWTLRPRTGVVPTTAVPSSLWGVPPTRRHQSSSRCVHLCTAARVQPSAQALTAATGTARALSVDSACRASPRHLVQRAVCQSPTALAISAFCCHCSWWRCRSCRRVSSWYHLVCCGRQKRSRSGILSFLSCSCRYCMPALAV
jgi:hypothetical protein